MVIVIVAVSGVAYIELSGSSTRITMTYTYTRGTQEITANGYPLIDKIGYNGVATYIIFNLNITTTKSISFDLNDCTVSCGNQSLTVMNVVAGIVNLQSGKINSGTVDFLLEGNITGNFQLGYSGNADVNIAN